MIMVKKVISVFLLSFVFVINLNSASLEFIEQMKYEVDYDKALEKAKEVKKPIMLVLGTKTCPWCRKLERQTLKKEDINDIVLKNFIPLILDRDDGDYPMEFVAKVVPTVIFINEKDEKQFEISYGYKNKKVFQTVLESAIIKYNSTK